MTTNPDPIDSECAKKQLQLCMNMLDANQMGHAWDAFSRAKDAMERMRYAWLWSEGPPVLAQNNGPSV